MQLRSALPIRQANLRLIQLDKHYDKMSVQKKQAFDQTHLHDLDPTDQIIILIENSAVTYEAPENSEQSTIFVDPDPGVQIALKVGTGTFVTPIQTNKVKYASNTFHKRLNQFEYIFPRTVDGKPPLAPAGTFQAINLGTRITVDKHNAGHLDFIRSTGPLLYIALGDPLVMDKKTGKVEQRDFNDSLLGYSFNISDLMYKGKLEY